MNWVRNKYAEWPDKPDLITKYFDEPDGVNVEEWPEKKLETFTLEALRDLLQHVYRNNAYYRDKMEEAGINPELPFDFADFARLGMTSKAELRTNPNLVLSVPRERVSQIHLSTGTTGGESIYMLHTWDDLFIRDLAPEMPGLFPVQRGDIVINALPYEMSSAGLSFHRVLQDGAQGAVVPAGKGGAYSDPVKTLKIMRDLQADVMITSPSYAIVLAETAEEAGISIADDIRLRHIWLTGEGCSDALRKRIERIWNCPALFYYGSLECGPIGIECSEQAGYHLTSAHVYVEIIDLVTGELLSPGQIGEIVVTTLLREGSPLIRYRTEDLGYIEDCECECGKKLRRLFLRGRTDDQIKVDGTSYSPFYLEEVLMRHEEVGNHYRFIVYPDHVRIEAELRKEYSHLPGLEATLASRIEYTSGIPNELVFVDNFIQDGKKAKRVLHNETIPVFGGN